MLKMRFPFIYSSTNLDTKHYKLPQIINWKLSIHCLAPQHILQFFHFCCTYCLCLCLWQLCSLLCGPPQCSTEQSRYWKKKVSAMGDFSWEILSLCLWRKEVPLSHWFAVSGDRIFSWHNASCLQTFLSWNLAFDFGRNTTTLSKFVGYMDLTNFRQISPGMMTNETVLGNFDNWNICPMVSIEATHLAYFLATPTLDADI